MTVDLTDAQASALRLIGWLIGCIDAGRELNGEARLDDDMPALQSVDHGASAVVTVGHLRAVAGIDLGT